MNKIFISVIALLVFTLLGAGCPKGPVAPQGEGEAVILRYRFPRGRILKYRSKSNTKMKFTFPFITEPQTVRSETTLDYLEEVIQEPLGGYAIVEQRITAYRLLLYQNNDLIYDSAQADKFPTQHQFANLLNLEKTVFKYEISPTGSIRGAEGFDTIGGAPAPIDISSAFEKAQPVFPEFALKAGDNWENKVDIPISTAKGLKGYMTINDKAKLVEVKKDTDSRKALIELNRNLNANLDMWDPKSKKFRPLVKGGGSALFTILLDIDKGIIILSDGRLKIVISSKVSDQPQMDEISIDWDSVVSTKLLE